jgi:hypothetical protein
MTSLLGLIFRSRDALRVFFTPLRAYDSLQQGAIERRSFGHGSAGDGKPLGDFSCEAHLRRR